jgi:uncharacterized protein
MVIAECFNIQDVDFGSAYTFKEYHSEKSGKDGEWTHTKITLKPKSTDKSYQNIVITPEEVNDNQFRVIGVFDRVL